MLRRVSLSIPKCFLPLTRWRHLPSSVLLRKRIFKSSLLFIFASLVSPVSGPQTPGINLSIEKRASARVRPGEHVQFSLSIRRLDGINDKALGVEITDFLDTRKLSYVPGTVEISPLLEHPVAIDRSQKIRVPDDSFPLSPFPLDELGFLLGDLSPDFRELFPLGSPFPDNPLVGIQVSYRAEAVVSMGTIRNSVALLTASLDSDLSNNESTSETFIDPFIDCLSACTPETGCCRPGFKNPDGTPECNNCGGLKQPPFQSIQQALNCIRDSGPSDNVTYLYSVFPRDPSGECRYESFTIDGTTAEVEDPPGVFTDFFVNIHIRGEGKPGARPEVWSNNDLSKPVVDLTSDSNDHLLLLENLDFFDPDGGGMGGDELAVINLAGPSSSLVLRDSVVRSAPTSGRYTATGLKLQGTTERVEITRVEFRDLRETGIEVNTPGNPEIRWSLFRLPHPDMGNDPVVWIDVLQGSPKVQNCTFVGHDPSSGSGSPAAKGIVFDDPDVVEVRNSVFAKLTVGIDKLSGAPPDSKLFQFNAFGANGLPYSANISHGPGEILCLEEEAEDCLNIFTDSKPSHLVAESQSLLIDRGCLDPNEELVRPGDLHGRTHPVDGDRPLDASGNIQRTCACGPNAWMPCGEDSDCPSGTCQASIVDVGAFEHHRRDVLNLLVSEEIDPQTGDSHSFLTWSDEDQLSDPSYKIYRLYRGFFNDCTPIQLAEIGDTTAADHFLASVGGPGLEEYLDMEADLDVETVRTTNTCQGYWYVVRGDRLSDPEGTIGFKSDGLNRVSSPDNCPFARNPDQTDTDGDGIGDACDSCPVVANPGACSLSGASCTSKLDCDPVFSETCDQSIVDCDGDGISDDTDNCPFVKNFSQHDCDGDGTGDACDNVFTGPACPQPLIDIVFQPGGKRPPNDVNATVKILNNDSDYAYTIDFSDDPGGVPQSGFSAYCPNCNECTSSCTDCNDQPNPKDNNDPGSSSPPEILPGAAATLSFNPYNDCCDNTGDVFYCGGVTITGHRYKDDEEGYDYTVLQEEVTKSGFLVVGAVPEGKGLPASTFCPAMTLDDGRDPNQDNCDDHYNPDQANCDGDDWGDACDCDDDGDGCFDNLDFDVCDQPPPTCIDSGPGLNCSGCGGFQDEECKDGLSIDGDVPPECKWPQP